MTHFFRLFSSMFRWIVATLLACVSLTAVAQSAKPYQYFRIGNERDATPTTHAGFALMGGGTDLDPAFQWMCEQSGGGDFLILRAHGDDDYNPYVQKICKVNSVATLILPNRESASDPFVLGRVKQAEAIFIAGGDQANYMNFWRGTPLESALNEAILRRIPIGGTSAGLAVLGEFIYSAQNDPPDGPDLTSKASLADPFNRQVVVVRGFLKIPLLQATITDTHFVARDRLGRLLVFMARVRQQNLVPRLSAIAVDQGSAVLLSPDGSARVVGSGNAYFLRTASKPSDLKEGTPLTFRGISAHKVLPGETFQVKNWSGGHSYELSVEAGQIHSTQPGGSPY